jgi:histone H1/5
LRNIRLINCVSRECHKITKVIKKNVKKIVAQIKVSVAGKKRNVCIAFGDTFFRNFGGKRVARQVQGDIIMYKTTGFALHVRVKKTKKGKLAARSVAVRANKARAVVQTRARGGFIVNGRVVKLKVGKSVPLLGGGRLTRTSRRTARVVGAKGQIVKIRRVVLSKRSRKGKKSVKRLNKKKRSVVFRVTLLVKKIAKKSKGVCSVPKFKKFGKKVFVKPFKPAQRKVSIKKCTIARRKKQAVLCKLAKKRAQILKCLLNRCQGKKLNKKFTKKALKARKLRRKRGIKRLVRKVKRFAKKAGRKGRRGGKKFIRKVKRFGKKIGRKGKKFGKRFGRKLKKAGKKFGRKVRKVGKKFGKRVKKIAKKAGKGKNIVGKGKAGAKKAK